jgi:Xaa-Pro aminopeptidase
MDFTGRIGRLRGLFCKHGIDAMLVSKLENIHYLSGFTGSTAQLIITVNELFFLTDSRYYEQFKQEVMGGYQLIPFYTGTLGGKLAELGSSAGIKKMGVEASALTYAQVLELQENAGMEIAPVSGVVEGLRIIKEPEEVDCLRRAIKLKEEAYSEVIKLLKPDVTEAETAAEFEYRIRLKGARASSFSPIVAFGENSCKPHASFSSRKLVPASPLLFDLGVKLDSYCSDFTRTIFFGGVSPGWEKIYNAVLEAKDAAATLGKPGMTGLEVDKLARDIIVARGFDSYNENGEERKYFGHGLGHGVGLEVHEGPRLHSKSADILEPGMIITIEPGIYLPGQGGVRIEDMYLVTDNGFENLNSLPTDLKVVQ